jgi:hypothetical protein
MTEGWQRRRSELNHLRLRNRFMTALQATLGRCAGDASATEDRLDVWPDLAGDFDGLLVEFEKEMSPAVFLLRPPLSHLDAAWRESAALLIHSLWLKRYPVRNWIAEARRCLDTANECHRQWREHGVNREAAIEILTRWQDCCAELNTAVSRLPSRIPLV